MKYWTTLIIAKDPFTGQLKNYSTSPVPGETKQDAELYCQNNGLGFCKIVGESFGEQDCSMEVEKAVINKNILSN